MTNPTVNNPSIRGLTYPLTIVNGNLGTSTDYAIKAQEIRSVIETRFFERVMRADYGVGDHTLEVINPGLINSEFQASIQAQVKGLTALSVYGDWITKGEDGIYKVFVMYAVEGVPQPPIEFSLSS